MKIFTYIVIAFFTIQLFVSFMNFIYIKLIFRKIYKHLQVKSNPLVSILIPARNEEKNIGHTLNSLLKQEYSNIEINVFDDQSNDRTKDIVVEFSKIDKRIRLIESQGLPPNWLGKNFACHILSNYANGEYFLFIDADVTIEKNLIQKLIGLYEKYKPGLISIFPHQKMLKLSEKITVPIIYFILLSLLPLFFVKNSKFSSLSAANGQLMFFPAKIYKEFNLHELFRNSPVEDIDIARFLKKNRIRVICLTGIREVSCRMYESLMDAINGFSKNIIKILGNNSILAILFWLITTFGFIPSLLFDSRVFLLLLVEFILIRILISITSNQNVFENLILSPIQQLVLGFIILKAINNKIFKRQIWKGRNIY